MHADHIGESSDWPNEASDLIASRPLSPAALLALRDHTHPYTPVSPQAFLPSGRERGTIAPRSSTFSCRYARTRTRTRALSTHARNHSTSSLQNHSRSKSWSLVSSFGNHLRKGQMQRYPLTWSRICTLQSAALSVRGMSLAILSATWPFGTEVVADAECVSAGRSSTSTSPAGRPWIATTGVSPCCRPRAPASAPDSSRTSWSPTARPCRLLHLHATTPTKTQTGIRNVGWQEPTHHRAGHASESPMSTSYSCLW